MIAACDTFRSGAVEQLKTHCNRLQIPLYERGYEKDPAKVAYEAAQQAARSKIDVLLVDTAGILYSVFKNAADEGNAHIPSFQSYTHFHASSNVWNC